MNTLSTISPAENTIAAASSRVVSIDIFRGLTMAVMIFVNALADVRGLPWWTYHAHANEDVMTYVDMVFPFFLFIVGISLPLSITQRLKKNPSLPALWLHVLLRVISLIGLGLILANAEKADAARMGMTGATWAFLALACASLYLFIYPKSKRFPAYSRILRLLGLAGVVILFALFRRTAHDGSSAWIDASYPEILGLIGYSYLAVAILYIPTRRWTWVQPVWFALLVGLCVLSTARILSFPSHLPLYLWPFGNGAMACIVMAGVVTANLLLWPDCQLNTRRALSFTVSFGLLMLIAGTVCIPLGISKIRATPTWSLYSIGASVLSIALLYWLCDIKHQTAWAFFLIPAGSNALLTYLLPDFWYFLTASLGITFWDTHLITGSPAVIKTVVFTLLMLACAAWLTKRKVRLQL